MNNIPNPLLSSLMKGLSGQMTTFDYNTKDSEEVISDLDQKRYRMEQEARSIDEKARKQVNPNDLAELNVLFGAARESSKNYVPQVEQYVQPQYNMQPIFEPLYQQDELPLIFGDSVQQNSQSGNCGLSKEDKLFFTLQIKGINDNLEKIYSLLSSQIIKPIEKKVSTKAKVKKAQELLLEATERDEGLKNDPLEETHG